MREHVCTEPNGLPICLVCHTDEPDAPKGRLPRTFVVAENYPSVVAWCRRTGTKLYSRHTFVATAAKALEGRRIATDDRVVVLGNPAPEILRELELARQAGARP